MRFLFVRPVFCFQLDRHGWRKCRFCRSKNRLFRFPLTKDTLAVQLIIPLVGLIVDFHHQVIQPPPRVLEQHQLRRYAPYLAHHIE